MELCAQTLIYSQDRGAIACDYNKAAYCLHAGVNRDMIFKHASELSSSIKPAWDAATRRPSTAMLAVIATIARESGAQVCSQSRENGALLRHYKDDRIKAIADRDNVREMFSLARAPAPMVSCRHRSSFVVHFVLFLSFVS